MGYALSTFSSYQDYYNWQRARGNTPLSPEAIEFMVNDGLARGISAATIENFLAGNPGDWQRIDEVNLDVVGGGQASTKEIAVVYQGAGNAVQGIAGGQTVTGSSLPIPARSDAEVHAMLNTSGVTLPTQIRNAGPGNVNGYSSNALGGATVPGFAGGQIAIGGGGGGLGGLNLTWILILVAMGIAAYFLLKD